MPPEAAVQFGGVMTQAVLLAAVSAAAAWICGLPFTEGGVGWYPPAVAAFMVFFSILPHWLRRS